MSRFPDKDTWDEIAAEAFSSETVHEFSESYNRKKSQILDGTYEERFSEIRRKRIAVSVFSAVCAATAGICIFTNLHTRIPDGSTQMLDNSSVSESENNKKDENNSTVPAETGAANVSKTVEITEKSEISETFIITEESERISGIQTSVSEVRVTAEAQSSSRVSSEQNLPAVTSVPEKKPATTVTTYNESERTDPDSENTGPVFNDKEELTMRKELISVLAMIMAFNASNGGMIHASELKYKISAENEAAVYISENMENLDFDESGRFSVPDVYAIYAYVNEKESLPEGYHEKIEKNADVTGDGVINRDDLNMFLEFTRVNMSLEERFGIDEYEYSLDYGSENLTEKFNNDILEYSSDVRFKEHIYQKLCSSIESGEIDVDIDKNGKADLMDAYKLYLYSLGYDKETGKIMLYDTRTGEYEKPAEIYDLSEIVECGDKIAEIVGTFKHYGMYDKEYETIGLLNYDHILRYFLEHSDITDECLDIKIFEEMYNFEYDDESLEKNFTDAEQFLYIVSNTINTVLKETRNRNLVTNEDKIEFELFDNHAEVSGYTGAGGKIVIPSEINGLPVTVIQEESMAFHKDITSVIIPDTVTVIEDLAFEDCENLAEIQFSENIKEIGEAAFGNCLKLKEIIIPDSVTKIKQFAFANCEGAEKIVVPGSIKEIPKYAFSGCFSAVEIIISEGVETIGYKSFDGCDSLASVTIPKSVTGISDTAFERFTIGADGAEYFISVAVNGWSGTYAEEYASANGIKFICVDTDTKPETVVNQPKPVKQTVLSAGDINGDGIADVSDLSLLSLSLVGEKNLTDEQKTAADVDRDGSVKLTDLARFKQFLSKVIEAF